MESFENWHEHSPLDPQELSLLRHCPIITLKDIPKPLIQISLLADTEWAEMGTMLRLGPADFFIQFQVLLTLSKCDRLLSVHMVLNKVGMVNYPRGRKAFGTKTFKTFFHMKNKHRYECILAFPFLKKKFKRGESNVRRKQM